ncbi:MAG: DNA repair protein RadA [Clostridia bacterium]|nr:DNA repair protein RadA [Clostridia bacterium]
MVNNNKKTVFVCSECGNEHSKWYGKCQACGAWSSLVEESRITKSGSSKSSSRNTGIVKSSESMKMSDIQLSENETRYKTGISEFDRTLGGGIVKGSVSLISGEPGIGKSTLLLQICRTMNKKVLYVSGEESASQIKMRAVRLSVNCDDLYVMCETNIENILDEVDKINPDILILDSIQTAYDAQISSPPGSITQTKQVALAVIEKTKSADMAALIVGHVNKDGAIAGPKVLEHMVDVVIYFEGERSNSFRILRTIKNRFGSTNEIGVFEMNENGLCEVSDPSESLLAGRPVNVSGNCTVCIMEGTRPIIAEIQALVTKSVFPSPKRLSQGVDFNRMSLIIAVLEKRLGYHFATQDVYLNIVGGLKIDEPACDAAIMLSLVSGFKNIPISEEVIAMGEIGLAGEIRSVSFLQKRINEAARLGFKVIIVPKRNLDKITVPEGVNLVGIKSIFEAVELFINDER